MGGVENKKMEERQALGMRNDAGPADKENDAEQAVKEKEEG